MAEYVFRKENNGSSVQVDRGSKITIELEENPSTGYQWMVRKIESAFLAPEGDVFSPGTPGRPGAGGSHQFFFRAIAAGETVLDLINKRAWQSADQAESRFELTIRILK